MRNILVFHLLVEFLSALFHGWASVPDIALGPPMNKRLRRT